MNLAFEEQLLERLKPDLDGIANSAYRRAELGNECWLSAEDFRQEAAVAAIRAARKFDSSRSDNLDAFVCWKVHKALVDLLRTPSIRGKGVRRRAYYRLKSRRSLEAIAAAANATGTLEPASAEPSPEDTAVDRDELTRALRRIRLLPKRQALAFLVKARGSTLAATARELGITDSGVSRLRTQARQTLLAEHFLDAQAERRPR